jgi:hypothetical protein
MFTTPLKIAANPARPDFWFMDAPLSWVDPTGLVITVPPGFRTDLATIPHFLEAIPDLDINGRSRRPGALHDWLYGGARWIGKAAADALLYQALLAEGMDVKGATMIYEGVHLFGQSAWEEDGTESMAGMFRSHDEYLAWLATGPRLNPAGA